MAPSPSEPGKREPAITSKKLEEMQKLLEQPESRVKGPKTPFIFFYIDKKDQLKAQNPGVKSHELAKLIGPLWSQLSDAEKQKYQQMAENDKLRVKNEIDEETRQNGGVPLPHRGSKKRLEKMIDKEQ